MWPDRYTEGPQERRARLGRKALEQRAGWHVRCKSRPRTPKPHPALGDPAGRAPAESWRNHEEARPARSGPRARRRARRRLRQEQPEPPQNLTATPTAQDVAQVNDAVAANPDYVNENVYESNDPSQLDPAGPGMAAVRPLFWWRTIRSVTRTFDTEFTNPDSAGRPTLAVVAVHKRMLGAFNILVGDSALAPDSLLRKPLDDRWERRLLLKRVRTDSTGADHWRLVGTSGVQVTSANALTHIESVRVQAGVLDTTITDPLQMHRLRRVLRIAAGTRSC